MPQQTPEQRRAAYQAAGLPYPGTQPATETITPTPQMQTPAAPQPTVLTPEQQTQYFASQGSSATPLSPQQWLAQQTQGTAPAQSQPSPTTQPVTAGALTMPATGSVVDLLNMAGVDSSQTNRKSLADQFGVQNYDFSAAKNKELADKFLAAYNANKGLPTPESGAEARTALSEFMDSQIPVQDSQEMFFDAYASMNPIERNLYDVMNSFLSTNTRRTSLMEEYSNLVQEQGIPGLQTELLNLEKIMDGTEDDIRDEITAGGGFVTESQVRAMTAARNKTLLREATFLENQLALKNDYVDQIMRFTQFDREEIDRQVDRKLGITEKLFNISQKMSDAARENYRNIIKDVGYSGLIDSIRSPQELMKTAQALGTTPDTLLRLATMPTNDQLDRELEQMKYNLSIEKFEEDKRQFGLQYALDMAKFNQTVNASQAVSPYRLEKSQRTIDQAKLLKDDVSRSTVGYGSYLAYLPETEARSFAARVDSLKANIFANELTAMREASKTGGAVGNVSDKEGERLSNILGALDTGQSPTQFNKQLDQVIDSVYSWNAQVMSIQKGFDYESARADGWSNEEIFNYVSHLK